jgi:predicted esterase
MTPATPTEPIPPATGTAPTLPAMMGDCPEFMDGATIMVAGHKSIVTKVGAPNKGGPLLFYWHGTGSSAAEGLNWTGNAEIVANGGIVASFNGSQSSKAGGDCSGTGAHNIADFKAADQIVACGVMKHGIDARRIYSTGCSAGGLQTGCMAQARSSYLAAAAPNSGGIVGGQPWEDMHSPAIFTMHGGASDMVIVTFSQTSASLDMSAKSHGSFVVNCDHGGGHCQVPADLSKAAWLFMKDHPFGVESPWKAAIPAGVPDYCKIY